MAIVRPALAEDTVSWAPNQSDTTTPSKPHSSRKMSWRSRPLPAQNSPASRLYASMTPHAPPRVPRPRRAGGIAPARLAPGTPCVDLESIDFGVVGDEVLDGDRHVARLHAPDEGHGQTSGQLGIFGVALEDPPADGGALQIDRGREQDMHPFRAASSPRSTPMRPTSSGSQVAPRAMPTGTVTPGVRRAPRSSPRTPFGPSDMRTAGTPSRGMACVRQNDAPPSRRHRSSMVRSAEVLRNSAYHRLHFA